MGILSKIQEESDFEIVDEFIQHYGMMIDSLEVVILSIKDKKRYKKGIDEIFRVIHNLKSASSYLGIEQMKKMCELVEETISVARELDGPASDELVDWLLLISDQLRCWYENLIDDEDLQQVNRHIIKIPLRLEQI